MAQSRICPTCLSEYPDIHGMIYPCGSYIGTPCADSWHKGPEYDPDPLTPDPLGDDGADGDGR